MFKKLMIVVTMMIFMIGIPARADTRNAESSAGMEFTGEWKAPVKSDVTLTAEEKEALPELENETELLPDMGDLRHSSNLTKLATMSGFTAVLLIFKLRKETKNQ